RIGDVEARASVSWQLATPPGGGDTNATVARGTRADVWLERSADTGHRRRLRVAPRGEPERARQALAEGGTGPAGIRAAPSSAGSHEVTIAPRLDAGHESHFPLVLDEFLKTIDECRWPAARAGRTLDKYTLLAEAAARIRAA